MYTADWCSRSSDLVSVACPKILGVWGEATQYDKTQNPYEKQTFITVSALQESKYILQNYILTVQNESKVKVERPEIWWKQLHNFWHVKTYN